MNAAHARAAASTGSALTYSVERPAAETSTSLSTRVGNDSASSAPTKPPIELPITTGQSIPSIEQTASAVLANPGIEMSSRGFSDSPKPGRSNATQRCVCLKCAMFSSQFCQTPPRPCRNSSGGFAPPVSTTCTIRPSISRSRDRLGQSISIHDRSSPSA
jgi:hypothetical protein